MPQLILSLDEKEDKKVMMLLKKWSTEDIKLSKYATIKRIIREFVEKEKE